MAIFAAGTSADPVARVARPESARGAMRVLARMPNSTARRLLIWSGFRAWSSSSVCRALGPRRAQPHRIRKKATV